MKRRALILLLISLGVLFILLLLNWQGLIINKTPTITMNPSPTNSVLPSETEVAISSPTYTPPPMCTPPLCAIGTSETYYCAETCLNGCGTTCATYTPSPTP